MTISIVITSVSPPTPAIKRFAQLPNCSVFVVGDKKTPGDWHHPHVRYISVDEQAELPCALSRKLPYNHYCRKMIGYLAAIQSGADAIYDTDDDNTPKANWSFPLFSGTFDTLKEYYGFVNIYQLYTDRLIWPRGLPLRLITSRFDFEIQAGAPGQQVGIWQGLADGDPDVDAIYRLTNGELCFFNDRNPILLRAGTLSPINSQNTLIRKELFPLLYLPTTVSFRFTDILRGLIAQPIMWAAGYALGFVGATVVQERNPHDYFQDFLSELPMYQHCEAVVDAVSAVVNESRSITSNFREAYRTLRAKDIVSERELVTLDAWLEDLERIRLIGCFERG